MGDKLSNEGQLHGIKAAWYANTPSGLIAVLECLCEQEFDGGTQYWEHAGEALDQHIETALLER